jgi:hypothetical protein
MQGNAPWTFNQKVEREKRAFESVHAVGPVSSSKALDDEARNVDQ